MLTMTDSYVALRRSAGYYVRDMQIAAVRGPARLKLVKWLLAKSIEFAEPGRVVESLLIDDQAVVRGTAIAVIDEDELLLLTEADEDLLATLTASAANLALSASDVEVSPVRDLVTLQVEGPLAWRAVEDALKGEHISSLLLNECRRYPSGGDLSRLIRIGTTAEFGYLVLVPVATRPRIEAEWEARLAELGGGMIDPGCLDRVRAEVNHPVLPDQACGLSAFEAGIAWLVSLEREDPYRGAAALTLEESTRRVVAAFSSGANFPAVGTEVVDGAVHVGVVQVSAPRCGRDDGFGLLLLDKPFDTPGLFFTAGGVGLRTVSRPAVEPESWIANMGAT